MCAGLAVARALVVFESMFGNTELIAHAVADGLAEQMPVDVRRAAADVTVPDDVDLLVVGGPTHAFSMSRAGTRRSAVDQGAPATAAAGPGLREWIEALHPSSKRLAVAAFDTRIKKRGVPGSAAKSAEKRLRRQGLRVVVPATSFWVTDSRGPLKADEQARAMHWGQQVARALRLPHGSST